jgi:hypothetical protein
MGLPGDKQRGVRKLAPMSAERPGKSHVWAWVLVAFVAAPVLYLLSVPPVKFIALKPERMTQTVGKTGRTVTAWLYRRGVNRGGASNLAMSPPAWLNTYAAPYEWLQRTPFAGRSLYAYHNWWWNLLAR